MKNIFTRGSKGIDYGFITNEDKPLIMRVYSYDVVNQIVIGYKIWDQAVNKTLFYAYNLFATPLFEGQIVLFYRVGDFNTLPVEKTTGFEYHIQDNNRVSWFCCPLNPLIFIKDLGNGTGKEVYYNNGVWVETDIALNLIAIGSSYYNNNPPYKVGRVYWGQRVGDKFLVYLPGYGSKQDTIEAETSTYKLEFDHDATGKILDFRVTLKDIKPWPDPDPTKFTVYFWNSYFWNKIEFAAPTGASSFDAWYNPGGVWYAWYNFPYSSPNPYPYFTWDTSYPTTFERIQGYPSGASGKGFIQNWYFRHKNYGATWFNEQIYMYPSDATMNATWTGYCVAGTLWEPTGVVIYNAIGPHKIICYWDGQYRAIQDYM